MSIAAMRYAKLVAREVPTGAHGVLFLLADACNRDTSTTYSGAWIGETLGLCERQVRRHLWALADAGVIRLEPQAGAAFVVHFPVLPKLSTPRTDVSGVNGRQPRTHLSATPDTSVRRPRTDVSAIPGSIPLDTAVAESVDDVAPPGTDVRKIMQAAARAERRRRDVEELGHDPAVWQIAPRRVAKG